ncbi:MAG TPA: hypothetical protein VM598_04180 [Bdellovibrionota bacterium]|nr:hypothetical protein [Bdellovibrionota bacterium]
MKAVVIALTFLVSTGGLAAGQSNLVVCTSERFSNDGFARAQSQALQDLNLTLGIHRISDAGGAFIERPFRASQPTVTIIPDTASGHQGLAIFQICVTLTKN